MSTILSQPELTTGKYAVDVLLEKEIEGRHPLVSVIISLFNYDKFVVPCLESVHAQTLDPIELIVVDDCSTDHSSRIVSNWLADRGSRFCRFQLLRHLFNCGLATTRNTAISYTRAPQVFILDADNLLYPRCLERLHGALENCQASFAYCYAENFGETQGLSNLIPWNPSTFPINNTIDAMVLLRKEVWEKVGGYSTNMPAMGWEDFDLWFKIARMKSWGILVPEILTRYRVHGTSMLNSVTNHKVPMLWSHLKATYPEFFPNEFGPPSALA
ncbi:MAG TPA: glycosyltransferase family A protein, partial [Gemmataceae bacterium]|nr:glycosyltransferase family A protein [Gemmataceae bacterium]